MLFLLLACSSAPPSVSVAGVVGQPDPSQTPSKAAAPSPEPAGLTYEVYVRSFQDSDGDGFGDLAGVEARLPYLAELGVRTVWLMPLFPAFGPAGYDVVDFDSIDADYGDEEDLASLVGAAHDAGIRVLIDLPFNHVHRDHPWFEEAEAGADRRSWFVTRSQPGDGERWFDSAQGGAYYAYFGEEMPDLDWEEPEVYAAMASVFQGWLDAGADGYRLDAVLMLVEEGADVEGTDASHALIAELREEVVADHPDVFFLAEASEWEVERSVTWFGSAAAPEADAVLDFPRRSALLEAVEDARADAVIDVVAAQAAAGVGGGMAPFLGSHDLDRLPSVVPSPEARRALMVAHMLLPGSPVLYYGEELDLPDASTGTGQDWAMRAAMPWDDGHEAGFTTGRAWFPADPSYLEGVNVADASLDPTSMLSLVRGLSCLREEVGLDSVASWTPIRAPSPGILAFERTGAAGRLLVAVNLGAARVRGVSLGVPGTWYDASTGARLRGSRGLDLGTLDGYEWRVLGATRASCVLPSGVEG